MAQAGDLFWVEGLEDNNAEILGTQDSVVLFEQSPQAGEMLTGVEVGNGRVALVIGQQSGREIYGASIVGYLTPP